MGCSGLTSQISTEAWQWLCPSLFTVYGLVTEGGKTLRAYPSAFQTKICHSRVIFTCLELSLI